METFKSNNMGQPVHFPYNNNNNNLIMNPPYVNYMGQQPNLGYLKCRPVASREQAMASQIDLDGSLWVFTDVMNGKIYTKQINNDGTATFNTYAYVKEEIPQYTSNDFVTKEQFNRVIQSLMAAMKPAENGGNSSSGGGRQGGSGSQGGGSGQMSYYTEPYGMMGRDPREGRAGARRRMYMEGKEMHKDTNSQLHELEAYLQELSSDITEMIKDASPEERATLHQKMTMLANKIV